MIFLPSRFASSKGWSSEWPVITTLISALAEVRVFLDVVEFFLTIVLAPLCVRDGGGRGGEAMIEVVVGGYQLGVEGGGSGG